MFFKTPIKFDYTADSVQSSQMCREAMNWTLSARALAKMSWELGVGSCGLGVVGIGPFEW
jgi:hypothetical protein